MQAKNADRGSNPRGVPAGSIPVGAMSKYWCFTINNPKKFNKDLNSSSSV